MNTPGWPVIGWLCLALAMVSGAERPAGAQVLPTEPISVGNGTLILGGEVTGTLGQDDPGFFNYTDYEYSNLRNFRIGVSVEVRANARLQVLAEMRLDQGHVFEPYALYLRIRPWPARRFDLQVGRVPPTFGAMSRSAYGSGNLLIGQPLAYQYLQSIRPDAIPATADDLLRMRGRGWLSSFPVGNQTAEAGLPLVNTSRWDTGVQMHGVAGMFDATGSVTVGSLSDPLVRDNNGGRQVAGRIVARPTPGFVLGVSASRGAWLDRSIDAALPAGQSTAGSRQAAVGGDVEFSAGAFLIRSEVIRATWTLPAVGSPAITDPLVTTSKLLEGRYRVLPGLSLAVRGDRLDFSTIVGSTRAAGWDAATWRIEAGPAWSVTRNVVLKGAWQRNRRDGGRVRRDTLISAQVVYWF